MFALKKRANTVAEDSADMIYQPYHVNIFAAICLLCCSSLQSSCFTKTNVENVFLNMLDHPLPLRANE